MNERNLYLVTTEWESDHEHCDYYVVADSFVDVFTQLNLCGAEKIISIKLMNKVIVL